MSNNNLLRKQVVSEVRRKRLVCLTVMSLMFIYISISLVFGDMGLFKYRELIKTKRNLDTQLAEIRKQNEEIRTQIKLLKEDPFYQEKLAREEFGFAKKDEYIFQYDR